MNGLRECYKDPYVIFLCCIFITANVLQQYWRIPVHVDGNLVDYFTALVLWFLSFTCLRFTTRPSLGLPRRLFWAAASLGLAILAFDEVFALHEFIMRHKLGVNDDYFKVVLWVCAGGALYITVRLEEPARLPKCFIIIGYLLHTAYMAVEISDEFRIQFVYDNITVFRYLEEELELLFLSTYLFAFKSMLEPTK